MTSCLLGVALLAILELIAGVLMAFSYSPAAPYASTKALPALLRSFHYWSSSILIAVALLVLLGAALRKWFASEPRSWFAALFLFFGSFLLQITGNLLPFDRHGVQTAVIEGAIANRAPILGATAKNIILGGPEFSEGTVKLWHTAHSYIFPLVILAGVALCFRGIKGDRKSYGLASAIPLIAVLASAISAPLGNQATTADFASFDAQVSWYTAPLDAALHAASSISQSAGWVGAIALPTLFAALLFGAPLLARKVKPAAISTGILGLALLFAVLTVFFVPGVAPLVGNRDPKLIASSGGAKEPLNPALFARGKEAFAKAGCVGCHGENGAHGTAGPTLTKVAERRGTDPGWYTRFIHEPKSVNPNSTMPPFSSLKEEELRALAEFLIHLETGS